MPDYTMVCGECNNLFEQYRYGELEDGDRVCPACHSGSVEVTWVIDQPFEDIANFACG